MRIGKHYIMLVLLLLVAKITPTQAQESCMGNLSDIHTDADFVCADTLENYIRINKQHRDIEVHFKWDKYNLELDYMGNRASLNNFAHKIDSIGIDKIDSIVVVSQSSPEGVYEHNLKLSRNRAKTIRKHLLEKHPELNGRLFVYPDGESWIRLREYVKKDTLMKKSTIEKVVSIIDSDINVGTKKWRMEQLPVYRYLLKTYYPRIRNSVFCIVYYSEIVPMKVESVFEPESIIGEIVPTPTSLAQPTETESHSALRSEGEVGWSPKLYLKTNAIGLGMAIANGAVEADLARHWSVALPIYYSAWNYFKTTIKFRTFATQPEVRYWPSEKNIGLFAGAHFGVASYNFAFDGDLRYQDHNRQTPAVGGGVSIGYRLPISKNNRWSVEFALGAGVYSNHYDTFLNTPTTKDGPMIETIKEVYCGIDRVAISLSYSFNLGQKGGKR